MPCATAMKNITLRLFRYDSRIRQTPKEQHQQQPEGAAVSCTMSDSEAESTALTISTAASAVTTSSKNYTTIKIPRGLRTLLNDITTEV